MTPHLSNATIAITLLYMDQVNTVFKGRISLKTANLYSKNFSKSQSNAW